MLFNSNPIIKRSIILFVAKHSSHRFFYFPPWLKICFRVENYTFDLNFKFIIYGGSRYTVTHNISYTYIQVTIRQFYFTPF